MDKVSKNRAGNFVSRQSLKVLVGMVCFRLYNFKFLKAAFQKI